MNEKIEKKLKEIPEKSGVYIMHNKAGEVIYVGKAKNLKRRVSSYFNKSTKAPKVWAMTQNVDWFEYIITPSELDAFSLENNLIKKHQPFYNILLKDSKTFPYIKVNLNENYPHFFVTRKVEKDGAKYFGPYLAGVSANSILEFLNKFFKLRTCKKALTKPEKRECLNYEMGLCLAPCTNKTSKENYRKEVDKALDFLKGNEHFVTQSLEQKMKNLAENENFEQAIEVRQILQMLKKLNAQSIANLPKNVNKDVVAYMTNNSTSAICVLTVQNGRILGMQTFSIIDPSLTESEVVENFVLTYYQNALVPSEIILSQKLLDEHLVQTILGKKTKFITNPKGINLKLLNMAKENATEHLEKNISRDKQKYDNTLGALHVLQQSLGLKTLPKRMECYDISHISGTNKVASMVVFKNGEAQKSDYRKFIIKTVQGNDDFASLKETLERRLVRYKNQDGASFCEKPNLLVIDGGKGQLGACLEVLKKLGLQNQIEIISLAKKIEEVYVPHKSEPILLGRSTTGLKLLQRIRDEAHRFAITFHRKTRSKEMLKSKLDEINGIGKKKKEALLMAFQTTENVAKADLQDLMQTKGISKTDAIKIYNFFNKEND